MDDLKTCHVESKVVNEIINNLNIIYRKEALPTITQGKTHEYLGMKVDFSSKGKVDEYGKQ